MVLVAYIRVEYHIMRHFLTDNIPNVWKLPNSYRDCLLITPDFTMRQKCYHVKNTMYDKIYNDKYAGKGGTSKCKA